MLEGQRLRVGPALAGDLEGARVAKTRSALDVGNLPLLRQLSEAPGQLVHDLRLESAQAIDVNLRRSEGDAPGFRVPGLVEYFRHVQQRLRGDAPAIQADAARIDLRIDERHLHPEIRGIKCGGIAA